MTLLDDRPATYRTLAREPMPRSSLSPWRFAARLAQREVRRRPGRTVLVALLVALPVVAMTVGSVLYRTTNDDWASTFERQYGAADLALRGNPELGAAEDAAPVADLLPDGSASIETVWTQTGLEQADGSSPRDVFVRFTDLPLGAPMVSGIVETHQGRIPAASDEVLLDSGSARRLGVQVGDTLALNRPSGSWQVVGIGRLASDHSQGLMVVHDFDRDRLRADRTEQLMLVDLPDDLGPADVDAVIGSLSSAGLYAENRWVSPFAGGAQDERVLAWGWVAGVLALAATGIVIASAFATSARRQLVTIGQLSANGAPAPLVLRTLALQGSWTGLIGVVGAVAVTAVGLLMLRPTVENVIDRSVGPYQFRLLDLAVVAVTAVVAATVAAAVPARTAARVPVLSALAGRRPLGEPPRRLVPIGLSLFLGGLALLFVAASGAEANQGGSSGGGDVFAAVAVVGGLGVVFGMCCATPLAVATVGRLGGSSASGIWRLAARSTARARSRSSAVITAVATAGAVAVAGVTVAAVAISDDAASDSLPRNVAIIETWTDYGFLDDEGVVDPPPLAPLTLDPEIRDRVDRLVPEARWVTLRAAGIDGRPFDPDTGPSAEGPMSPGIEEVRFDPFVATIADPEVIEVAGLSAADEALLAEADLLEIAPWRAPEDSALIIDPGPDLVLTDTDGDIEVSRTVSASDSASPRFAMLMTAERADALGLDVVDIGTMLVNPTDLTEAQRRELGYLSSGDDGRIAFVEPGDPAPTPDGTTENPMSGLSVQVAHDTQQLPIALINTIIVALAVLFTLLVVAIGLALSATESRDERDVLVAVGAPPRTLTRVAGAKAFTLAATGVILAIPTGLLPTWVVYRTIGEEMVQVPWPAIGLLVVTVPVAAGLAAWAASALSRSIRPVRMSTAFAD